MPKPKLQPPNGVEKRLLTRDVVAAYGGIAVVGRALAITTQAVAAWGKFIPASRVWQVLAEQPELKAKVIEVPIRYKRVIVMKKIERFVKV